MKFRRFSLILAFAGLAPALRADVIYLKSGDPVKGHISRRSGTEVEVEVPVSSGVSDVRVIQMADIDHIEEADPSLPAFAELSKAATLPNSLPSQDYDTLIKDKLLPFLSQFPKSTKTVDVQALIAGLSDEKKRVIHGDTKIEGEWFDAHELQAEKEQVAATLAYQQIEVAGSNGLVEGLNAFRDFERKYPGARMLPAAIDAARARIARLRQVALTGLQSFPDRLAARQNGWKMVSEPQRSQLMAAAVNADKADKDTLAAASKNGDLWMPILPNSKEGLEAIVRTSDAEGKRLAAMPVDQMRASIAASYAGRQKLTTGDLDGAAASFDKASAYWPASLMNRRNPILLAAARKAAAATPTPSPSPSPNIDWQGH